MSMLEAESLTQHIWHQYDVACTYVPSIALFHAHRKNLCQYGNSCHISVHHPQNVLGIIIMHRGCAQG